MYNRSWLGVGGCNNFMLYNLAVRISVASWLPVLLCSTAKVICVVNGIQGSVFLKILYPYVTICYCNQSQVDILLGSGCNSLLCVLKWHQLAFVCMFCPRVNFPSTDTLSVCTNMVLRRGGGRLEPLMKD